jgi:outer membrane protein assembly factor BamB
MPHEFCMSLKVPPLQPDGTPTARPLGLAKLPADNTIYVGSTRSIIALNSSGTVKWQFDENPSAFILLGPNVGPDGNIYAVANEGLGVFSLTPQGNLRWSLPERYDRPIVSYQEIVFGTLAQSRLYFHADRHLRAVSLNGAEVFSYPDSLVNADP